MANSVSNFADIEVLETSQNGHIKNKSSNLLDIKFSNGIEPHFRQKNPVKSYTEGERQDVEDHAVLESRRVVEEAGMASASKSTYRSTDDSMESDNTTSDEDDIPLTPANPLNMENSSKKKRFVKDGHIAGQGKVQQKEKASLHKMENPPRTAAPQAFEDLLYEDEFELKTEEENLEIKLEDVDVFGYKKSVEEPTSNYQSKTDSIEITVPPLPLNDYYTEVVLIKQEKIEKFEGFPSSDEHSLPKDPERCRSRSPVKEVGRRGRSACPRGRGNARSRGRRRGRGRVCGVQGDRAVEPHPSDEEGPGSCSMDRDHDSSRAERDAEDKRQWRRRQDQDREEFYAADDGQDSVLLRDEDRQFHWSSMDSFRGKREAFIPQSTGSVAYYATIYEAFRSYWDDSILTEIVEETNRYAKSISSAQFQANWYDTNVHEVLILFAFWIMLGIHKMPTIKSCFSVNPLLKTDVFRSMFTAKRYQNLVCALHFANNDAKPCDASKLYCFGRVLEHLNSKFQQNFVPAQNVVIDESLTLWKGMLHLKQFIQTQVARFGIKTFELCDSATGYLWSFIVYAGKDSNDEPVTDSPILKSTEVVIMLMRPLLNKGYTLFLDSWFNSPVLARFLKSNGTDCVGTVRSTRKEVPPFFTHADLRQGEFVGRHAGDLSVMAWQDKNRVLLISTYHGMEEGNAQHSDRLKPQLVVDYNKNMDGVDRKDQMLEPYLLERKECKKWYMNLFKRLLHCSILNSRILLESSTGGKLDDWACRLQLVDYIITNHLSRIPQTRLRNTPNTSYRPFPHTAQQHWPRWLDDEPTTGRRRRKRCVNCLKNGLKTSRTVLQCEHCKVPLCAVPCFKEFHQ